MSGRIRIKRQIENNLFNIGDIISDMVSDITSFVSGSVNQILDPSLFPSGISQIETDASNTMDDTETPSTPIEVTTTKIISADFICIGPETYYDNKKDIQRFNNSDSVILPKKCGERLLKSNMKLYAVKITNEIINVSSYGKVIGFDAPDRHIVVPSWIMASLFSHPGDKISIDTINVGKISKIKFSVPKCISDPQSVIEFELRNHSLSYVGKELSIKMFDKKYDIIVKEQQPLYVGIIENQDIDIDIEILD